MHIKSIFHVFSIIFLTVFMISAVSANDNQTDIVNYAQVNDEYIGQDITNNSFTDFNNDLKECNGTFNMTHDYIHKESDKMGSVYKINSLVINGNNHTLDGSNSDYHFSFTYGDEIGNGSSSDRRVHLTINDLTFKNFNDVSYELRGDVTFNNVNFINSTSYETLITAYLRSNITFNNVNFDVNSSENIIYVFYSNLTINNSNLRNSNNQNTLIEQYRGHLIINNSIFSNFNSANGAIINFKGDTFSIKNSKFLNSSASFNGGAIIAKYFPLYDTAEKKYFSSDPIIIENCEFSNLSADNDGGAIYIDLDSGSGNVPQSMNIINSTFTDCTSRYGGAIAVQGGVLNIVNSSFKDNSASFEGGALFTTWTDVNMTNVIISRNSAEKNAGAIYFDKGKLIIKNSTICGNKVNGQKSNAANAIYAHDVDVEFSDSTFDNGGISVYADFAGDSKLENIEKNDDIFLMNNTDYIVSVESPGIKLNLTKNEIIVDELPSKFDSREWGWVTSAKLQGDNDDCWAFATAASLESALLKATGVEYNISQNYIQTLQLKYSQYGDIRISLTGFAYSGLGNALSWIGTLPSDRAYDDRGMIADTDLSDSRIHLQDAMIIHAGQNNTQELIKRAILKYGAVSIQMILSEPSEPINSIGEDISVMDHGIHFISLIGWDDDYVYNNTWSGEYHKGIWITKDSLTQFGQEFYDDDRILAMDYYAIVPQNPAIAYIFENDENYHVNYQTDLTGLTGFDGNYTVYSNEFTSKYSEVIGAVGTYFNDSGIEYSFDIYVNGELMHSQSGVSEFAGFRTIKLTKDVPVKINDTFKVVFKNSALPYQAYSRVHYMPNMTFVSSDGETFTDITLENRTVCLKVYTKEVDIFTKDLIKIYKNDSKFEASVGVSNATVTFEINGGTYNRTSDEKGVAKIAINLRPGNYTIKTIFNKTTVENNIEVLPTLIAENLVKYFRNESQFDISLVDGNGNVVSNVNITMNINGVFYNRTTNENGIARLNINLAPGEYILTAIDPLTGLMMSYNITVLPVLNASNIEMVYKDGTQFKAKLVDGSGAPMINSAITFNINGVFYTRYTDSSGIAILNINLMAGEYIITSQYENAVISNKIIISAKED